MCDAFIFLRIVLGILIKLVGKVTAKKLIRSPRLFILSQPR